MTTVRHADEPTEGLDPPPFPHLDLLLMIGPLVGHGFITAVDTYAEASGIGGGPAALSQGLSPLDGVLVPAFVISELKTAFIMGFCIYLPFLLVDLVVTCVLTSMGMMMMPPVIISAPFKVLLFVLADGWHLVARALSLSFA